MRSSPSINRRSLSSRPVGRAREGEGWAAEEGGGGAEGEDARWSDPQSTDPLPLFASSESSLADAAEDEEEDAQQPGSRRLRRPQRLPLSPPLPSFAAADSTAPPSPSPPIPLSLPASFTPPPRRSSPHLSSSHRTPRSTHRPPPLVLVHSASRSAATPHVTSEAALAAAAQLLREEEAALEKREERLSAIRRHHRFARSFLHSASLVAFVCQQLLCIALIVLASLWKHTAGIAVGSAAFVIGLSGSIVWYYQLLDSKRVWVICFVRPIWFSFRALLLCVLLLYVLVHALHGDPAWSPYPVDCPSSAASVACVRLGGNATQALAFLPAPVTSSSLSSTRLALLSYASSMAGWSVLDSLTYSDTRAQEDVVLVRVRALTSVLGLPSDVNIRIACNAQHKSEVWVQSASRVSLWSADYGLNVRHVDDLHQWMAAVEDDGVGCQQSARREEK